MSERDEQRRVIPVTEEKLEVDTQREKTGGVRVHKKVHEHEEVIDKALKTTDVEIKRVDVGEFVDAATHTRQEGETTVIPVHEERVVVETRLFLREEIHITRTQSTQRRPQTVTLRREEATIEHDEEPGDKEDTHPRKR